MRKLILFFVITLFISCTSNEDLRMKVENELIGTWQPISGESYNKETNGYDDHYLYDECGQQGRMIFENNGTIETYSYETKQEDECTKNETVYFNWDIVYEGVLSISGADSDFYYEIENGQLRLEEIDDINDDSNDVTYWKKIK